jgi:ice-binding like protein
MHRSTISSLILGLLAAGGSTACSDSEGDEAGTTGTTGTTKVALGSAGNYVILAKSGISTVPASSLTGDLGVSPAAASYLTGFALVTDTPNVFSTSPQVTGKVYAADYASPTPSHLTTAVSDMELAFTDAAGRAANVTELGAGDIGGKTLGPGVYQWGTGLLIPTDVTLKGSATAVWIFQVAEDLTVSNAARVVLASGAQAKNVFWQVSGQVVIGTTAHFEGIVLSQTAVTLETGASLNGRLLAQSNVKLDTSTVVEPAP